MKKINKHIWLFALMLGLILVSCEKQIVLDLETAQPKIVIEGNITSDPGPYTVTLTTSGDYYTAEGIEPVTNAMVIISDDIGNTDTLSELSQGKYQTSGLTGESLRTYSIVVVHEEMEYSGADYLPQKVYIDSLEFEKIENSGPGPGSGGNNDSEYTVYCYFNDPVETEDYYRFNILVNGVPVSGNRNFYSLSSDQIFNGYHVKRALRGIEAFPGDTITIGLNAIGYNTYEYFRTLNDALNSGGMGSTPYNPISNLSNDALGYFGAYTNDVQKIILE
jgi:uncharacterized protein DUF4249